MARQRGSHSLLELHFPTAGLNRKLAYRQQPPFTTPDAKNVRPEGVFMGRQRGGSRPGILRSHRGQIGGATAPVRLLTSVRYEDTSGLTVWSDNMVGTGALDASSRWDEAGHTAGEDITLSNGLATRAASDSAEAGVMLDSQVTALIDASAGDVEVGIFIVPYKGQHHGKYHIYARSVDATPTDDGVKATIDFDNGDGTADVTITGYESVGPSTISSGPTTYSTIGFEAAGWFSLRISTADLASAFFNGLALDTLDLTTLPVVAGNRVGFGMEADYNTPTGGQNQVDRFRLMYHNTDSNPNKSRDLLVASANGELWIEDMPGSMKEIGTYTSLVTLSSSTQLQAIDYQGKLYIADHDDPKLLATNVSISGGSKNLLDSDDVADWTAIGLDVDEHVVQITDTGDGGTDVTGTYTIASIAAGEITISPAAAATTTNATAHIVRYAKVYDPKTDTLSTWKDAALSGTPARSDMPAGFSTIARWRDRLVLGGGKAQPHLWWMSKRGDPDDFDISSTLVGRAVVGTSADAGQLGEPLIALIPHTDDCLLFMSMTSIWVMRGDPTMGGQLDRLSDHIGIAGRLAYAYTAEEDLVFLSHDGLYSIPAGCGQPPISLSREVLPDELRGIDADNNVVSMAYDIEFRGIHIYISRKLDTFTADDPPTTDHFWFDMETKSFWPMAFGIVDHEAYACYDHTSLDTHGSGVILGTREGYLMAYNRYMDQDEGGNAIASHVLYGPLSIAGQFNEGLLLELSGVTAEDGGTVNWDVFVGQTHEEAFNASSFASGSFDQTGFSYKGRPRARGASLIVKLSNGASRSWGIEELLAVVRRGGVRRRF